ERERERGSGGACVPCDQQRSEKAHRAIVRVNRFFKDGVFRSASQNVKHIALGKISVHFSEEAFDPVGNVAARTQRTCEVNSTSTASLLCFTVQRHSKIYFMAQKFTEQTECRPKHKI
ncbi:unnamed protein product, partial [Musa textilis]